MPIIGTGLPGYDAWKLASPPEDEELQCWRCGVCITSLADAHLADAGYFDEVLCGGCDEQLQQEKEEEKEEEGRILAWMRQREPSTTEQLAAEAAAHVGYPTSHPTPGWLVELAQRVHKEGGA